jgi:DNA helicase-2/ATP-dependent DNA helicase PcrA
MQADILHDLNPAQRDAVTRTDGPLLVLAGAGSGKTRVITRRVAHLIRERRAAAFEITAVTFTNKAAAEMRERVEALRGGDAPAGAWISTFHSMCLRVLRRDAARIGYAPGFLVYDTADQLAVVKAAMQDLELGTDSYPPRQVLSRISGAKNHLQRPDQFRQEHRDVVGTVVAKIYERYQERLAGSNAMDFDDLIMQTIRLFTEQPEVLARAQGHARYLMVDEYQDTNPSQYRLIRFLSRASGNVCVVGDEDQSIYAFRGSDFRNILRFEKDFPGARVIKLERNYRSTGTILDAASALVANNRERIGKTLFTENPRGDRIRVCRLYTDRDEAEWVAARMAATQAQGSLSDAAILYRTNAQSRLVEEALLQAGVPYRIYGAVRFYDRREIKDVLAYLKLLANPADDVSLDRVLNVPPRGIGQATFEALRRVAAERRRPLLESAGALLDLGTLPTRAANALRRFAEMMEELRGEVLALPPDALVREVVRRTGYDEHLRGEGPEVGRARLENLEQLVTAAADFGEAGGQGLADFLDRVSLVSDADVVDGQAGVALMTLHCAKGLEFPRVTIVGMEEGLFPHSRANDAASDVEEERRLLYVGMTRAREELTLTSCCVRRVFGAETAVQPSRFLDEIPGARVASEQPGPPGRMDAEEVLDGIRYRPDPGAAGGARSSRRRLDFDAILKKGMAQREPTLRYDEAPDFRPGARVFHPRYGEGKILAREGEGEDLKLTVSFSGHRPKKFLARFAKLQRV